MNIFSPSEIVVVKDWIKRAEYACSMLKSESAGPALSSLDQLIEEYMAFTYRSGDDDIEQKPAKEGSESFKLKDAVLTYIGEIKGYVLNARLWLADIQEALAASDGRPSIDNLNKIFENRVNISMEEVKLVESIIVRGNEWRQKAQKLLQKGIIPEINDLRLLYKEAQKMPVVVEEEVFIGSKLETAEVLQRRIVLVFATMYRKKAVATVQLSEAEKLEQETLKENVKFPELEALSDLILKVKDWIHNAETALLIHRTPRVSLMYQSCIDLEFTLTSLM